MLRSCDRPVCLSLISAVAFLAVTCAPLVWCFPQNTGSGQEMRTLCNACAIETAGKQEEPPDPNAKPQKCRICGTATLDASIGESICEPCAHAELQCRRCLLSMGWPEHLDKIEPAHNRIYFISDRDGEQEIFSMTEDGKDVRQLTKNDFYDADPSVSPDGRWIAFVSLRSNRPDLFIVDVHGKHERRLTNNDPQLEEGGPTWDPSGETLVFTIHRTTDGQGEPPREFHRIRRDGLCLRKVEVEGHFVACWTPDISPDGCTMLFSHYLKKGAPQHIFSRNDSGVAEQLTNVPHNYYPSFSPDGSKILFASTRDTCWEIYVMSPDGSAQTRITNNKFHDAMPCWSPDGTKIAFVRGVEEKGAKNQEIFVMNADGTGEVRLTGSARVDHSPSWR
ncbi:MAG: hypothetical protein RDV41_13570 [Planctomycetota bacterium]|nr:hypothetical protein [Planctomycetota bacterium]